LYTPQNTPKKNKWDYFIDRFKELPGLVQEILLGKLHGDVRVWNLQHRTMVIQAKELTKYQLWLHVLEFLSALLPLEHFVINQHQIIVRETQEFMWNHKRCYFQPLQIQV
jgi:uncharacterized Tic20 family protein